jgi:hypothetical protein
MANSLVWADPCDPIAADGRKGNRGLLDDLHVLGPLTFERMAVDAGHGRPGLSGLQNESSLQRNLQQKGQLAVGLRVATDDEDRPLPHAAER